MNSSNIKKELAKRYTMATYLAIKDFCSEAFWCAVSGLAIVACLVVFVIPFIAYLVK